MAEREVAPPPIEPTSVMSPSTDVALPEGTGREMDDFERYLMDRQNEGTDPQIDAYASIIQQVLTAETPDDVLTPVEAVKARDRVGVPLVLHGFDMNQSDYDVGSPFYASMKVVNTMTGDAEVVNCGHKKVLAQLIKLDQFNQYPYQVQFREQGKSKKSGETMLALVKWV